MILKGDAIVKRMRDLQIGDVLLMEFDGIGSEQCGIRPGVVFQNNIGNQSSPNIIALPLSSKVKKRTLPTHVVLGAKDYNLAVDSVVLCENPQRMSKQRILKEITRLDKQAMKKIAIGSLLSSSAIAFLSEQELLQAHKEARRLNRIKQ